MKADRFQPTTEKLTKRCLAWDEKLLSMGAKEVLIKSVAQAIPTYIMSVFQLPAGVCEALTRCIRRYWWGSTNGKRKTHWMAWRKFTRAKGTGGLGFRDLRLFNQALLARQAWRLIEYPTSLCARVLKARYYPDGDLLDTAFPTNQSPTWRSIVHGLDLLKKGVIWRVGSGTGIRIWRSPWVPRTPSLRVLGKARPCRLTWVADLIDATRMTWKVDLLHRFFQAADVEIILKIKLPTKPLPDFIAWHYEKNGLFSVRSAYRLAVDLQDMERGENIHGSGEGKLWRVLWQIPVPEKVKIFAWRLTHEGLATKENKFRKTIEVVATCDICGMADETGYHATVVCPHARWLRDAVRSQWKLPTEEQLRWTGPSWLLILLSTLDVDEAAQLLLLLWRTWFVRNEITHGAKAPAVTASMGFLMTYWGGVVFSPNAKHPCGYEREASSKVLPETRKARAGG